MDSTNVTLILTAVVCGFCVFLCVILSFLCWSVRRVQRKLDDVTGNGTQYIVTDKRQTEGNKYTGKPVAQVRVPSAVYSDPGETVTVLERETGGKEGLISSGLHASGAGLACTVPSTFSQSPEPASCTQNVANTPERSERVLFEFVNEGFSPDNRLHSGSVAEEDSETSQPIYGNQEVFAEQPIYENNNEEEDIYQNTGELRDINNPEWDRCNTLNIIDVH